MGLGAIFVLLVVVVVLFVVGGIFLAARRRARQSSVSQGYAGGASEGGRPPYAVPNPKQQAREQVTMPESASSAEPDADRSR